MAITESMERLYEPLVAAGLPVPPTTWLAYAAALVSHRERPIFVDFAIDETTGQGTLLVVTVTQAIHVSGAVSSPVPVTWTRPLASVSRLAAGPGDWNAVAGGNDDAASWILVWSEPSAEVAQPLPLLRAYPRPAGLGTAALQAVRLVQHHWDVADDA